jgi:hypothetical protein
VIFPGFSVRVALFISLTMGALLLFSGQALAVTPWWGLGAGSRPAHLPTEAGEEAELFVTAENLGDAPLDAEETPVTIADTLPAGLEAVGIAAARPGLEADFSRPRFIPCSLEKLSCTFKGTLAPYDELEVRIKVVVQSGEQSGGENKATVTGGNAAMKAISRPLVFSGEPTPFGLEDFRVRYEEEGGEEDIQAGSHPFQFTTTVALNQGPDKGPIEGISNNHKPKVEPVGLAKDTHTKFPVGFIGNPQPVPTCSLAQFLTTPTAGPNPEENGCPPQTAIGVTSVTVDEPDTVGFLTVTQPLFNLEPYAGEPARFGFYVVPSLAPVPVVLDTSLRSNAGEGAVPGKSEDYGINVNANNINQIAGLINVRVTTWGTPSDPRHDNARGWGCLFEARGVGHHSPCPTSEAEHPPAFITLPTSCAAPMQASQEASPWAEPTVFDTLLPPEALPQLEGCNRLPFSPTIHSEPTSDSATSPTGLNFDINVPNEGLINSKEGALASSEIKKAIVTLPQGFTTNPSVAEGLHACTLAEFKATTIEPKSGCTEESKIGSAEIESPVVNQKVKGSLFVAHQHENPYGNLLSLYLVFRNQELGILVKQALKVVPDPVTGQLTTEVDNIPQLPFSKFHLEFRSGQRAPLVTPQACGTYAVKAKLYPYSEPAVPLQDESSFQITQGPEGLPCPSGGLPPFHPILEAGTLNNAAGTFSPFVTRITRKDSEQEISHFSIKLPPGVVGKLAGVAECSDAAIAAAKAREHEGGGQEELNAPSCPSSSEVGRTLVGSGVGNVLAYAPGKLYLAGPYHGSNLSLVAITAAKVGPFDLGTVVVRFALRINPETAEVFVDAQGSDPIPHIVDGIPVHLREVRSYVDRPNFTLNPTNCTRTSTASTVLGSGLDFASEVDDRPITVTSPFQAADCAALPFKPRLALSLKGGTRRGAHPAFKAVLKMNGIGESGVARTQVTLPHSEFIENAHFNTICTRAQFKEGGGNGERCPAGSIYGKARATTPILGEPLSGPIFLRSSEHKLPDVVIALHNAQVDVVLDGRVDSVNGQLRNTFESTPDAPVSEVVLELDGGKKGLFVNSTNLCAATHKAIADFTGQNGKEYDFNPVVRAQGCKGKAKKHKNKKSKREAR